MDQVRENVTLQAKGYVWNETEQQWIKPFELDQWGLGYDSRGYLCVKEPSTFTARNKARFAPKTAPQPPEIEQVLLGLSE